MSLNIPDSCTLPTAERPLRLAEFDELFATAVRRVEPLTATHARLHLTGPVELAEQVRDLTARETECCSFFTFTVTPDGEAVVLDIEVPAAYTEVLTSLTALAEPGTVAERAGRPPARGDRGRRRHARVGGRQPGRRRAGRTARRRCRVPLPVLDADVRPRRRRW